MTERSPPVLGSHPGNARDRDDVKHFKFISGLNRCIPQRGTAKFRSLNQNKTGAYFVSVVVLCAAALSTIVRPACGDYLPIPSPHALLGSPKRDQ